MEWVELGRIGSPYGVQGWMHIQSFTEPPEGILDYPVWNVRTAGGAAKACHLAEGRLHGSGVVVRLEGISDRDAAASFRGAQIEVRRSELPAPGKRQYYRADLVGFEVRNLEGATLGTVMHFVDGPSGAMMVVRGEAERWIPAIPQYLRKVDLDGRGIQVDWPAELE